MIDMHFHSTLSDGKNTPEQIVNRAKFMGLDFIVSTEHDVINRKTGKILNGEGIQTCEGVEISAKNYEDNKSLHLTCYSGVFKGKIEDVLLNTLSGKKEMIKAQINKLIDKGFKIDLQEFYTFFKNKGVNIENLNKYNISEFIHKSEDNISLIQEITGENLGVLGFFRTFLKKGGKYFDEYTIKVPNYEPSVETSCELARKNNAIISIAHPNFSFARDGISGFKEKVGYYIDCGVNGIEINIKASKKWIELILELQKKHNLALTFGSDNHKIGKSDNKHGDFGTTHPLLTDDFMQSELKKFKNRLGI